MERSEEVKECQVVEPERSRIKEESSKPSDINPFLVEPILRKLLMKVEKVDQLKDLRKMCILWDTVNTEELEDRAFKGKLKAIDFQWNNRFATKEKAEKELEQFLEDTREIPRLFTSFKFNIPESLKVLQNHPSFFSDYPISRVEIVNITYQRMKIFEKVKVGMKYFLCLIGPNLKEIQITRPKNEKSLDQFEPKIPNWTEPSQELILPKLEKLDIEEREWCDFFNSALGTGSGHLTFLRLESLPGGDIGSFPGLDPARMTCLDIGGFEGSSMTLEFTAGLMTLVEKGMKLLNLGLRNGLGDDTPVSFAQNLPRICSNLTHLFAIQCSTLTTLDLRMEFFAFWPGSEDEIEAEVATYGKIQLPVFQALHTLYFDFLLHLHISNEKPYIFSLIETTHSPPLHFPSLVDASFKSEWSMRVLCANPEPNELAQDSRYHFKSLDLMRMYLEDVEVWNLQYLALIESVDKLKTPAKLLQQVEIPWIDSLCNLHITDVTAPLKLAHLKNLKTLTVGEYELKIVTYPKEKVLEKPDSEESSEFNSDSDSEISLESYEYYQREASVSEYLSRFNEAKLLNLSYIKFNELGINEERIKEDFIRYFPFPVQFGY